MVVRQVELYAARERVRREQEAKAVEECTFRPKLCKGTEQRAVKVNQPPGQAGRQLVLVLIGCWPLLLLLGVGGWVQGQPPVPERLFQRLEEAAISKISIQCQLEEQKMQVRTTRTQP